MFRFVSKLAAFLSPLILLFGIVEYKVGFLPSDYDRKQQIAERSIGNAEIIILGSSHTFYGIKASSLDAPALNLAYHSQDLYYDNRIFLKYLPRAGNLKTVILSVSYPSLAVETENSPDAWRTAFYRRSWQIPRQSFIPDLADYSSIALFGADASRNYLLKNQLPSAEEIDDTGSSSLPAAKSASKQTDINSVVIHESLMNNDLIPGNLRHLTEIVEGAQNKNVRVILITTPCFRAYYDNINPQNYAAMQNALRDFSLEYKVEYYNYLSDARFTIDDFRDTNHLNNQGSEKLTAIVKKEILNHPKESGETFTSQNKN